MGEYSLLEKRYLLWGLLCLLIRVGKSVEDRVYRWEVKYEYKSPDCFKKMVISINGMTPGPQINAKQGDTIIVEVTNRLLTENIAIHWHGIRQFNNCWSDGAGSISQCPIMPGETFTYKFVVEEPGTFMYHAHYGLQKEAGLYGSIKVDLPDGQIEPFHYDYDHTILLNDWYHKNSYEETIGLSSIPFEYVGEPQSLLINGRGRFECSKFDESICNASSVECSPHVFTVEPTKTYRLRIGSVTSLSALSFQIEDHEMTVVEADGHYVEEFVVKNLYIYSGETYSVVFTAKSQSASTINYWITTNVVTRNPKTPLGLAVLNYSPSDASKSPSTPPPSGPLWNDTSSRLNQSLAIVARSNSIEPPPPPSSHRTIVLLNTQNKVNGYTRWSLNNVSFTPPSTPYLAALKYNLTTAFDQTAPPDHYESASYDIFGVARNVNATSGSGIYRLEFGSVVDVVLQNANAMKEGESETHPWHLHGHDFWVMGFGEGKFERERDSQRFNLRNPIMKNTVALHPYGWTALRFQANNPGVWLFHCHIESHFFMGMGVVFTEGIDRVGDLPSSIMGCGQTKSFFKP